MPTGQEFKPGVLLLAAGQSRRFTGIKQLAQLNHHSLLQNALERLSAIECHDRVATLGANIETIQQQIRWPENVKQIEIPDWQEGISASIRGGLAAMQHCSHLLVLLADQPDITLDDINLLLQISRNNPTKIVCANYAERNAVPAIFPASDYAVLHTLTGDSGASGYLNQPGSQTGLISMAMANGATDIDTPQDLRQWQQQKRLKHD